MIAQRTERMCEEIQRKFYAMGYGNTPLVSIGLENGSQILAKLEWFNPSGSIKSRAAFFMIYEKLLKDDKNKERTFVEGTSGNTGIAIAEVCRTLGIKSQIIIPPGTMKETIEKLRETGTDLIITQEENNVTSTEKAINMAVEKSINESERYVNLHQHGNEMNWKSHYYTTGPEILKRYDGNMDFLIIAMGTGGSIIGLSRFFKERKNTVNVMIQADSNSYIQGIRNFRKAKDKKLIIDNLDVIDEMYSVSDRDAAGGVRELIQVYGIYAGFSSGANYIVAKRFAKNYPGSKILTVFPDSAEKYISLYSKLNIWSLDKAGTTDFRDLNLLSNNVKVL